MQGKQNLDLSLKSMEAHTHLPVVEKVIWNRVQARIQEVDASVHTCFCYNMQEKQFLPTLHQTRFNAAVQCFPFAFLFKQLVQFLMAFQKGKFKVLSQTDGGFWGFISDHFIRLKQNKIRREKNPFSSKSVLLTLAFLQVSLTFLQSNCCRSLLARACCSRQMTGLIQYGSSCAPK